MSKQTELNLACTKLMQAIKNGNKPLTEAEYNKRWVDFNLRNKKTKKFKEAK